MGKYGIFLIMGNAGFISSTVGVLKAEAHNSFADSNTHANYESPYASY